MRLIYYLGMSTAGLLRKAQESGILLESPGNESKIPVQNPMGEAGSPPKKSGWQCRAVLLPLLLVLDLNSAPLSLTSRKNSPKT